MDRTEASDAFNAGSIPVGCIYTTLIWLLLYGVKDMKERLKNILDKLLKYKNLVFPVMVVALSDVKALGLTQKVRSKLLG